MVIKMNRNKCIQELNEKGYTITERSGNERQFTTNCSDESDLSFLEVRDNNGELLGWFYQTKNETIAELEQRVIDWIKKEEGR